MEYDPIYLQAHHITDGEQTLTATVRRMGQCAPASTRATS